MTRRTTRNPAASPQVAANKTPLLSFGPQSIVGMATVERDQTRSGNGTETAQRSPDRPTEARREQATARRTDPKPPTQRRRTPAGRGKHPEGRNAATGLSGTERSGTGGRTGDRQRRLPEPQPVRPPVQRSDVERRERSGGAELVFLRPEGVSWSVGGGAGAGRRRGMRA